MDNTIEILRKLDEIERNQRNLWRLSQHTYAQTRPKLPWAAAAALGALAAFTLYMQYPRLPDGIRSEVDPLIATIKNRSYTVGQWYADYVGNVDRSFLPSSSTLTLTELTPIESCRWRAALLVRESSGNYAHQGNSYGYIGGYAFGANALHIVGLVNTPPRAAKLGRAPYHQEFLNEPANWRIAGGKPAFLQNRLLQDRAVTVLANINIADGFKSRVLMRTQKEKIAGFAAAAHLKGLTAAISWYARGEDSMDANGTRTSDYARMGEQSITRKSNLCGENANTPPALPEWLKWMEKAI